MASHGEIPWDITDLDIAWFLYCFVSTLRVFLLDAVYQIASRRAEPFLAFMLLLL